MILDVLLPLVVNTERFVELLFRDLGQRREPDDERVSSLLADHCKEAMDRRLDRRIAEHLLGYLRELLEYRLDIARVDDAVRGDGVPHSTNRTYGVLDELLAECGQLLRNLPLRILHLAVHVARELLHAVGHFLERGERRIGQRTKSGGEIVHTQNRLAHRGGERRVERVHQLADRHMRAHGHLGERVV